MLAAVVAFTGTATAAAGPWEEGWQAYERGDYAAALSLWLPLAEQGFTAVQVNVASMYAKGEGVSPDATAAAEWYRRAAEQGSAIARFNLGVMYHRGRGLPRDEAEAAKWYGLAAEQGNADAQYNLAYLYSDGRGVKQDYVMAYVWFSLAASRGDEDAAGNRDRVADLLTPAQLEYAESLARGWETAGGDDSEPQ